jgi:hypothetical protein
VGCEEKAHSRHGAHEDLTGPPPPPHRPLDGFSFDLGASWRAVVRGFQPVRAEAGLLLGCLRL